MKTFIVLVSVIAFASANTLHRATGWGSGGLPSPSIDVELAAAAAAAASGQMTGSHALTELATGNTAGPAYLQSLSQSLVAVSQDELINQVATADKPLGDTSTINLVGAENDAGGHCIGQRCLQATLGGAIGASVTHQGQAQSSGEGSLAVEAESLNVVSEK